MANIPQLVLPGNEQRPVPLLFVKQKEACAMLSIGERLLNQLAEQGAVKVKFIGNAKRYQMASLIEYSQTDLYGDNEI